MPKQFPADFSGLLTSLADSGIRFVVLGGIAAVLHGSDYRTRDVDIAYSRDDGNLKRLADFLDPLGVRLRGVKDTVPFRPDALTLKSGSNFTFETNMGQLDLLGHVPGLGDFREVEAASIEMEVEGRKIRVLDIPGLIAAKKAAGRAKDLLMIPELDALLAIRKAADKRGA